MSWPNEEEEGVVPIVGHEHYLRLKGIIGEVVTTIRVL